MADVTVNVIEPATNFDLLTVDELKILLGVAPSDTSQDAQLAMMISIYSAYVAEMCNRTFAREKVIETWRELLQRPRVPDALAGQGRRYRINVRGPAADMQNDQYELEQASGKLSNVLLHSAESTRGRSRSMSSTPAGSICRRGPAPAQASNRDPDPRGAHAQSASAGRRHPPNHAQVEPHRLL